MNLRRFRKAETFNKVVTWCLIVVFVVGQISLVPSAEAARPGSSTSSAGSAPPPAATTAESFQPDLFTGRAGTSLKIDVPPGRKNMQPQVGVGYSSSPVNGWLGVGWGLDLGYIERSTKYGVPKYDATDIFTFQLGGGNSEMVKLPDGTYRAEDEGVFLKFEDLGGTNGWRATDKSGVKYYLGRTSSSRLENGTQIFRWCLDQVVDVNGNTINYSYATYGGQPHPSQIDYTGHTNGLAPACRVSFEWEDRPDVERNMRRGWEITTPKRLKNIRTYATVAGSLSLAGRHAFGYATSARTGRSLLRTYTKFGNDDATSLPPTTFTYQDAEQPTYSIATLNGSAGQIAWNVAVGGMSCQHDNYGFIHPYGGAICGAIPYGPTVVCTPGTRNVGGLNVTVGGDGSIQIPAGQDYYVHAWTAVYLTSARAVDFSRWGSWDVAALWVESSAGGMTGPYSSNVSAIPMSAGWNIIHLVGYNENQGYSMGLNTAVASIGSLMSPSIAVEPQLAGDVNGDALNDLISFDGASGTWKVSISQGANFALPVTWLTGFGTSSHAPVLGDWNADGRTDIGIYQNGTWRFATSTGTYFQPDSVAGITFGAGTSLTGDFNGDGILDLGTYQNGEWKIAIGTGSSFTYNPAFDLTVSIGGALPPNDVRWRIRNASYDCGGSNYGCQSPGGNPPCGSPGYQTYLVSGYYNFGNGPTATVGSDGSLQYNGDRDRHSWSSISVYSRNGGNKSFSPWGSWDVACFWVEDGAGLRQIAYGSLGSVYFAPGWSTIHIVGYNQNQGFSYGISSSLTAQFDVVSPDIIAIPTRNVSHNTGDFNGDGLTDLAIIDDAYVPECRSCRDILEKGKSTGDGAYTIDPDGPGGNAPITVTCQMSLAGGGWTKLTASVANTTLNQDSGSARQYLYVYGSAWYRSPANALVWDWNSGKDAYGSWDSSAGSFTINPSGEKTLYGVSASSGGGAQPKCLIYYNNSKDPNAATVQICQDVPHAFPGTCQDGVTVYVRETVVAAPPVQTNTVSVALSNGRGFTQQVPWAIDFNAATYSTADYNGDGISDLGFFDKTSGHIVVARGSGAGFSTSAALPVTFSQTTAADQMQVGEFNGDGLPDPAIFNPVTGTAELSYSAGTAPDLLKMVDNGMGGLTTLTYQPSSKMANSPMPFAVQVVTSVAMSDGLGNSSQKTYAYSGGQYDAPTKEFRGFGRVEVRDADQTVAVTEFHQDYQKKGRAYRSAVYDVNGKLWTKQERTYSSSTPYAGLAAHFTHLDQVDVFDYDGDATFTQTRVRHTYDAYGNLTGSYLEGDVNVVGDEKSTVTTFNLNPSAWILNTASLVQSFDAASNLVSQVRTYYDGSANLATPPVRGIVTREEQWLDLPAPQWIGSSVSFDVYGNPTVSTDPMGRSVTNVYDSTFTYLTTTKSPLGHQRVQTYDPRFGQVISVKDQNNVTGYTYYDALGRKTGAAIVDPATSQTIVQSETEYRLSSVPTRIKTTVYAQPGKGGAMVSYVFIDGLGRKIQSREPSEVAGRQNVTGAAQYDPKGQMIRQWTAYEDAYSEEFVPHTAVSGLAAPEEYEYDPLGRIVRRQTSAGAVTATAYDDRKTTYTDANGHVRRVFSDAHGRVVRVEEDNGGETYAMTYAYDAQNNVVLVTDHLGNQVRATFDSLGRKIASDDPNMGHWTYEYNARNLMTRQVDARGSAIEFTFDAMDRLVRKHYVPAAGIDALADAVYTYDTAGVAFSTGRLVRVDDASGSLTFSYDFMNRTVGETRTIDGTSYTDQNTYDLLGRPVRYTYPNGHQVDYAYNAAGGIETVTLKAGAVTHPIVTDITYNAAGMVTRIAYGNGTVSDYTYNPQTLKLSHKRTLAPNGTTPLQDLDYVRDPVGNILQITDTVNTGTQLFQYDDLNRLIRAEGSSYGIQNFAYDAIGNMTSKAGMTMTYGAGPAGPHAVTATSAGHALTYDANGNMTGRVAAATGTLAMRYDAENRLAEVRSTSVGPATCSLTAGMNLVGFSSLGAATTVTNALKQFGTAYTQVTRVRPQDQKFESFVGNASFNQFTNVTPGEAYWVYCTNAAGATMNLPSIAGTPVARTLTNGWHLLAAPPRAMTVASWLAPLVPGVDYGQVKAYDTATASFVPATDVTPGRGYSVQILRPCSWTPMAAGQTETTRFVYDADGARVKKTTAAGTTFFLGDSYEVQGSLTNEYVFSGKDRVASLNSAGELRFYLTDHLNSANLVVDGSGQVVELAEYAPYGQLSKRTGTADTPFKFTGQRLDSEFGLYYYGARYYDPELGRFVAADTVVQDAGDPQSWNRYSYARNNPILFTDPSGNIFIIDDFIMAIVIGALIGAAIGGTMAYINGGDVAQGALLGAVTGAISGGFGYAAEAFVAGTSPMAYLGRAAINSVGSAASGAAGAAIRGEPIGKAALEGFKMSAIMSASNFIVGQWSGYTKKGEMRRLVNELKVDDGIKEIGVNGITAKLKDAKIEMYLSEFDEFIYNPTHGWWGLADIVECGQELFFGPSSFSRDLGSYMTSLSGQTVSIVAHSQGTIMTTRALQVMGNNGAKFNSASTVTFNNPPIDTVQAHMAAWKVGISKVAYLPDHRDFVSAIGSPIFLPTSIGPTLRGELGHWHCHRSFVNAFPVK